MDRRIYLLILICFCCASTYAQSDTPVSSYKKHLLEKGIILLVYDTTTSTKDKTILSDYNFNSYRKLNQHIRLQIERGPLVELVSLNEMTELGQPIEKEFLEQKKNELPVQEIKHDILVRLNIGMGYAAKNYGEIDY